MNGELESTWKFSTRELQDTKFERCPLDRKARYHKENIIKGYQQATNCLQA
jgi:hypothetical protein